MKILEKSFYNLNRIDLLDGIRIGLIHWMIDSEVMNPFRRMSPNGGLYE